MFQKPAFGTTATGFGAQSTFGSTAANTSSPFSGFKPAGTAGAFGAAPAFGAAATAQPQQQGGLFGGASTSGGLFGAATPAAAPAFGATTGGFGFGAAAPATGGLFNSNTSGGLFNTQQNATGFGAKPAGFGFGGTAAQNTSGGLFGSAQPSGGTLFANNAPATGGLFNTGGFGGAAVTGTAHVKYAPLVGTDVVVKSGTSQNINIKHHCITCMKEYESKSLEELRLEDYSAGRKGSAGGVFGFNQPQDNKPLFPTTSTFGAPASSAPGVFGGALGSTAGFGQTNTFSFGGGATQANTNTSGLFGAQPFGQTSTAGTSLFGAPASTQASTFGTNTSTFGFGSNLQNTSGGGLFGAKPAGAGAFGAAAPASSALGAFGSPGMFAKPLATQAPAFGAAQPGTSVGAFGAAAPAGGLFGAGAFGKPPTSQPSFGLAAQPTLGGLNTGLGANTFGAGKPAGQGFGTLGGGLFAQQPATNTFRTGLDSGLGGGLFGNTTGSLGLGAAANTTNVANLSGAAGGSVHEQILALAARPYGDSPLFKDLLPDSSNTAEEALRPTNPAAISAVLARDNEYRVTSPQAVRLALRPRTKHDKRSLFDGLEQSDSSLEDKLCLKPSRKRLVLRPQQKNDLHLELRSPEEPVSDRTSNSLQAADKENSNLSTEDVERVKKNLEFPNNNNSNTEVRSPAPGRWLGAPSPSPGWPDEPSIAGDTPRLYPTLDKELQSEASERRSSWLTTKPLRPGPTASDSVENSVRELGVRSHSPLERARDQVEVSEPPPPHPAGVRCTRAGYYTIPTLEDMTNFLRADGTCKVPDLTIGRTNYGNVYYDSEIDVAGLDIDSLVHFLNKEVIVYPDDSVKPAVGRGLNRRAVVTLDRVWPRDKTELKPIEDPQRLLKMDYEGKLRRVCDKHDTKFIEYRPQTGSWVFRVEHFSKYGLTDSDEEDIDTPDVLKRQLTVQQTLQQQAAPQTQVPKPPGLGDLGGLGGLGSLRGLVSEDSIFAMQQTSINLLSGASKAFEMDTTEDNTDGHSLYQDTRALSVKSPTSELARLEHRQSAHLQLMKASLYADTEMEDDISVSTGDQLVPMLAAPAPLLEPMPTPHIPRVMHDVEQEEGQGIEVVSELAMKPLEIQPHTIVLRYHRKIPPFKHTIAGRLGASCLADQSVSLARHSRAGFGPQGTLVYPTTYLLHSLPPTAELCDISKYVEGRGPDDWSESVVARLQLTQPDKHFDVPEMIAKHLENLFEFSRFVECAEGREGGEGRCPRLELCPAPKERLAALHQLIRDAQEYCHHKQRFGVSGAYCLEVWKLCDALWGADLENDGIPGTTPSAIVDRHRRLTAWLTEGVSDITSAGLRQPVEADGIVSDGHCGHIWTLLLGGRVLEACKLAREQNDLNMAALIAQAGGDAALRSLVARQLALWSECGADGLVDARRRDILRLLAGHCPDALYHAHWMQALLATHTYLTEPVASLERVVRRYESFSDSQTDDPETSTPRDNSAMRRPAPAYMPDDDDDAADGSCVLDLRYYLIRARALQLRPAPGPAHYTPDPFDYSLSFLLGVWFGAPSPESVRGVAEQLAAAGRWRAAVHALMYLRDDRSRAHLIRAMLSRHMRCEEDAGSLSRLRLPPQWALLARALRAQYEHQPRLQAECLIGAERWSEAHDVLIQQLLPDAVLADDLESIAPLLERLNEAAKRSEVRGWEAGGQALYHYIHVCNEIRSLVGASEQDRGALARRLEALRPRIAAACKALGQLNPSCARGRCARAELGARLVSLLAAGGAAPAQRAVLTRVLQLPPGTVHTQHHEITAELAEQASEMCIESADSPCRVSRPIPI